MFYRLRTPQCGIVRPATEPGCHIGAKDLRMLDVIQKGPRTLLDNLMRIFCSSVMTGNHNKDLVLTNIPSETSFPNNLIKALPAVCSLAHWPGEFAAAHQQNL